MHINFRDKNLLLYSIKLVTSGDNFSQELFRLLVKEFAMHMQLKNLLWRTWLLQRWIKENIC